MIQSSSLYTYVLDDKIKWHFPTVALCSPPTLFSSFSLEYRPNPTSPRARGGHVPESRTGPVKPGILEVRPHNHTTGLFSAFSPPIVNINKNESSTFQSQIHNRISD